MNNQKPITITVEVGGIEVSRTFALEDGQLNTYTNWGQMLQSMVDTLLDDELKF